MSVVEQGRRLSELTVAETMSEGIISVPRTALLTEVAHLMASRRIHCVVVDELPEDGAGPWGVVSDLDVVAAATVRGLGDQTAAGTAATALVTVRSDETLLRAGQLMTEHAAAHLVVVDPETGAPVGVLSTLDVAAALDGAGGVRRVAPEPYAAADAAEPYGLGLGG